MAVCMDKHKEDKPMAKTIAEFYIREWIKRNFPVKDLHLEFTGPRCAVLTDRNGDRIRVVYHNGEVQLTDAW